MGAELNPAQRLHSLGQSLWLDSINRVMLRTGTLARYVRELAVTGLTSNPTILGHAMAAGSDYDSSLAGRASDGVTDPQELVYALALEDLAEAASLFRPEWERTAGVDGYVSLEVPPDVAYDAAATVALARRLHGPGLPQPAGKDPRHPPGPDRHGRDDHRRDRGERDAAVLRQPLPAHRRRLHSCPAAPPRRRAGPGGAVSGLTVYLPLGLSRRPPAAAGTSWPAGAGDGTEGLLLPSAAAVRQALAGTRRKPARVRNGCCGHPPRPRTQIFPTPTIWAAWPSPAPSTPSRKRRCSPSPTMEPWMTASTRITRRRSGASPR